MMSMTDEHDWCAAKLKLGATLVSLLLLLLLGSRGRAPPEAASPRGAPPQRHSLPPPRGSPYQRQLVADRSDGKRRVRLYLECKVAVHTHTARIVALNMVHDAQVVGLTTLGLQGEGMGCRVRGVGGGMMPR